MTQNDALALSAAAKYHQRLALVHVKVNALQHRFAAKAFIQSPYADIRTCPVVHPIARKSLVRKKSETRTPIAAATAEVVARPTPSAPPVAPNPLLHAMIAIK